MSKVKIYGVCSKIEKGNSTLIQCIKYLHFQMKDKTGCEDMVGIFELCNPHLLPEDVLITHLSAKFSLPTNNLTKSQSLELFVANISPKNQRLHRDNRRGNVLKRLQRSTNKKDITEKQKHYIMNNNKNICKSPIKEQENKRVSTASGGPEPKRSKISWP